LSGIQVLIESARQRLLAIDHLAGVERLSHAGPVALFASGNRRKAIFPIGPNGLLLR